MPLIASAIRLFSYFHILLLCAVLIVPPGYADDTAPSFTGSWIVNDELSDDVDNLVGKAIKRSGGKIKRSSAKEREAEAAPHQGKFRGGPKNQEMYDHLAYDDWFSIEHETTAFRFYYPGDFERHFFTDRRSRTATATGSGEFANEDFSFAFWEGDVLVVESRPRDGGRAVERYSLIPETGQLRAELSLAPLNFPSRLEIVRIFDPADPSDIPAAGN